MGSWRDGRSRRRGDRAGRDGRHPRRGAGSGVPRAGARRAGRRPRGRAPVGTGDDATGRRRHGPRPSRQRLPWDRGCRPQRWDGRSRRGDRGSCPRLGFATPCATLAAAEGRVAAADRRRRTHLVSQAAKRVFAGATDIMPTPGPLELVIILVIALLILGPGKLPDVGAALGKSIREFRKASSDVQEAVNVNVDTSPLPPTAATEAAPPAAAPAPTPTAAQGAAAASTTAVAAVAADSAPGAAASTGTPSASSSADSPTAAG